MEEYEKMLEIPHIEELEGKECLSLRHLWEEVFWEESKEFTDYYFQEKAIRNRAFTLRIGENNVSMLYLSPYPMMLRTEKGFAEQEINYIVGVATRKKYRHRGYMDMLLREALSFIREKGQPFAFLMPANPEIYRPYQFAYIYDKEIYLLKGDLGKENPLAKADSAALAKYASSYLEKNYDVFIKRDAAYYRAMERELAAQNGRIYPIYGEDSMIEGYFFYTKEEGRGEIQEAILSDRRGECPVYASGRKQPVIMARIIDVQAMLSLLRTKTMDVLCSIRVKDPILNENDGIWNCRIMPDDAAIHKAGDDDFKKKTGSLAFECSVDIGALTAWVFGYKKGKECFAFPENADKGAALDKLEEIRRLTRVFINEIV